MKKRMTSLVLALAMCLPLCTTVFADPGASVEEKRAYLMSNSNVPAYFLNSVEDEIILKIYEEIAVNGATVASYDQVTENMEPSTQTISPMSSIPSSDFKMSTLVLKSKGDAKLKVWYYTVYTHYEWFDKDPFCRRRDGITVNWDNTLFSYEAGSFAVISYLKNDVNTTWRSYASDYSPDEVNQGGLGGSFDLHYDKGNYLTGTLYFQLTTEFGGSGKRTTINSQYAHTYDLVVAALGFSKDGPSVVFETTYKRKLCASSYTLTL